MYKTYLLFLSIILQSIAFSQSNGIVIHAEFKSNKVCNSDSTINRITYHIRKDILRIDIKGGNANSSIIFQPEASKIWVLYHHEQVFYSMTGAELKNLEQEILYKSKEFSDGFEKMDSISKEQTKMMWPGGNPFTFEDPEYELVNKKDTLISQLICDKYKGTLNNGSTQLFYSSTLKTTGIKDDELEILKSFSDFMGKGVKALSGNMDFAHIYKKEVGAYPILLENYSGEMLCNTYWFKFIYRKNLPNKLFEIPIQYGKFDNPLGNR